uniref:SCP domain-containing protein n=1 Tax=Paramormyrops kingsleyae TaxID=1676925 RepID=A0A3B3T211_9TELE
RLVSCLGWVLFCFAPACLFCLILCGMSCCETWSGLMLEIDISLFSFVSLLQSWNASLESVAKDYAVQCIWDHNPDLEDTGENLYITSGALNISQALTNWYEERHHFTYETNSCVEEQMCGHYTQVVWADTDTIGCASHACDTVKGISLDRAVILVCNYFPGGNYENELPYRKGKPCTQCPDKIQKCKNNICGRYKAPAFPLLLGSSTPPAPLENLLLQTGILHSPSTP